MIYGSDFRVWGLGLRVKGSEFRVSSLGFKFGKLGFGGLGALACQVFQIKLEFVELVFVWIRAPLPTTPPH